VLGSYQSATLFRSATIIYNALAELPKSGVGYAHPSFLGLPLPKAITTQLKN
jgi:hypothetical protein